MIERHIAGVRRRLTHLGGLARATEDAERKILAAATERLGTVQGDLGKLRPRVLLEDGAAEEYQGLVSERGQLERVIGRAKQVLGE